MHRGKCHFTGADRLGSVRLDAADLTRVRAEEAGAFHGFRPNQCRGDDRDEPCFTCTLHGEVDQGQLELRSDTGQEIEARTADLCTALQVDRTELLPDVDVV